MNRYRLDIEYDGTNYYGFQKQNHNNLKTIEQSLLNAIENLTKNKVKISVSGRTDAGVHALSQTIHFDLNNLINENQLINGLNYYLKKSNDDIVINHCKIVNHDFHARLSAKMRYYRYLIINRKSRLVINKNRAWHVINKIDVNKMIDASKEIIGRYDFTSFRDSDCQSKTPIRTINNIKITSVDDLIIIDICAKSFLHHMVRNIAGTLVYFGLDKYQNITMKDILDAKDRSISGPNAPACGLYFLKTDY